MPDRFSFESEDHSASIMIPYSGMSMKPSFQEGDKLIVEKNPKKLEQGDIVFFKDLAANEFVVHRLVQEDKMLIKGDYSLYFDNGEIKIYGKVIGFIRKEIEVQWGSKGQRFKRALAFFSFYRTKRQLFRFFSYAMIILLTFLSSLFYSKSKRGHI